MGWPFSRKPAKATEPQKKAVQPRLITIPPYGQRMGQLTRFGTVWLDIAKITSVQFDPPDGCGAEIAMEGDHEPLHLSDEDAAALGRFIEEQVADGRELERQFSSTV